METINEKVLERIKTSYMLYQDKNFTESLNDAMVMIDAFLDDMDDSKVGIKKSIRKNEFEKLKCSIVNSFADIIGCDHLDIACYDEDNEVLREHRRLVDEYEPVFSKLLNIVNADNFIVVSRLAQFAHDNYMENYAYLETKRDAIELFYNHGIVEYPANNGSDKEFLKFYNEEINRITSKGLEKVKTGK